MDKRILLVVGILAIVGAGVLWYVQPVPEIGNEYFTIEPEGWIDDNVESSEDGDKEVNVFKATRGKATIEGYQEDYHVEGEILSFFYSGLYQGIGFKDVYVDEQFEVDSANSSLGAKKELVSNYVKMQIGKDMYPGDGVVEAFVLGKEENEDFVFYLFVDSDFKEQLGFVNILWGDDFADLSTLHIRPYDFSKVKDGIYIDKLTGDIDWFVQEPIKGGIVVGEITVPILQEISAYQFPNATMVMVR
jgi:hypothetical protein